jgi:Rrf2 family iron-sulfur cluster assembly transcriptional regulator
VSLAGISDRQKISLSYLEQLFGKLRRYGLVESVRGPGGGYCLARPTSEMTVTDIIRAVDEPLDATQCGGRENCRDDERCMTHELWSTLNDKMYEFLSSVTLAELVNQQLQKTGGQVAVVHDARGGTGRGHVPRPWPSKAEPSTAMFAPVYLDHNATYPADPAVLEAMLPYLSAQFGNASSRHEYGRAARRAIDEARSQVAAAVGAHASEVVFTSGGSEANNLLIKGAAACLKPGLLAVSAIEHPCA